MKNNKLLFIIILTVFVTLIVFSQYKPEKNENNTIITDENATTITPTVTEKQEIGSNFTRFVKGKTACESCHLSGKPYVPQAYTLEPHVKGGRYCLNCHKIDHNVHPINNTVTCDKCHGTGSVGIPKYINGHISCEDCHDYPNPLLPSKGNLVRIHLPRGVECTTCHTDSCGNCHDKPENTEKWAKREKHFKTILNLQ